MFAPAEFLDLQHTAHPKLFENQNYVWDALKQIESYLQFRLKPAVFGELTGKPFISNRVFVGSGTVIEQGAVLKGPAWIGENCQIRSGCYVRENVIVGDGVVMGNSCEFKNSILFDEAQVPHFNYVGDSILAYRSHLGPGAALADGQGFEPWLPCGKHAFQACALDHSATHPDAKVKAATGGTARRAAVASRCKIRRSRRTPR